jgi:hypothetical protein
MENILTKNSTIMIKNSTVIIAAGIILIGIISHGLIDNIFERQNLKDKNTTELEFKKLEINEKLLGVKPIILSTKEFEIIYLPAIRFNNGYIDIDYGLFKYENQKLVKIPFQN